MAARGVIKDVGRVLDIPYGEVDRIAKLIPEELNITLDKALRDEPRLKEEIAASETTAKLFEIARNEKCNRVRWQVLNWNENAIRLYKKYGSTIDDEWLNCDFDRNGILYYNKLI